MVSDETHSASPSEVSNTSVDVFSISFTFLFLWFGKFIYFVIAASNPL